MSARPLLLGAFVAAAVVGVGIVAVQVSRSVTAPPPARSAPVPLLPPPPRADDAPKLRVEADPLGFFVPVTRERIEAWPGPGVRAFVGGFGRLDPDAAAAGLFVRGADGSFELRALDVAPAARVDGAARAGFLAAATAWAVERGVLQSADGAAVVPIAPTPPPAVPTDATAGRVPAVGADLAAWAPADAPFVRFRSTEAAFRFSDLADRIAARLAATAGDGRDFGSLRWALHDLTLPAVWSANPEGTRGAGECAVVLDGLPGRGRARIAALLRIVDPELYRMESEAGVSYAALPEHLWAPADDPHPAERARRNVRRTVADVEAIGADAEMLRRITACDGPRLADDPEWRAAAPDRTPDGAEAAFLFIPRSVREAARAASAGTAAADGARFASEGIAHVWAGWTGADVPSGRVFSAATGAGRGPVTPLAALVSLRVLSDAKGADVEARFETADDAARAAKALEACSVPFQDGAATCAHTRRDVAALAVMDRPQKDFAERCFVVLGWKPVCPAGGTYVVHPVTREVSCTAHGTDAKPTPSPRAPSRVLRDLRVGTSADAAADAAPNDTRVVRFRVPIDWNR